MWESRDSEFAKLFWKLGLGEEGGDKRESWKRRQGQKEILFIYFVFSFIRLKGLEFVLISQEDWYRLRDK